MLIRLWLRWSLGCGAFAILFAAMAVTPGRAQPADDLSCAYFSTDPNDRSGPPIRFHADLSDFGQRAQTDSPATGTADFVLDRETLRLTWTVAFEDLTTEPVAMHIHGPVPAEGSAPPVFDLAAAPFESPVNGEKILTQGEVAYLVQHLFYVNLHTAQYPQGEIRGLVRKVRPEC